MSKYLVVALSLVMINNAHARNTVDQYSINELLKTKEAKEVLLDVPLIFGAGSTAKVLKKYGEVMSNRKTNAFMKSDKKACQWAMLSALKSLQTRALKEGMNAVVNIESYYQKREFVSRTHFECGAGAVMAGVTLKGILVKQKK